MTGLSLEEVFDRIGLLPDCKLPEDHSIHYGHRTMEGIEIYFLSNQTDQEKVIQPEFRVTGKQPELWEATSGSIRVLPSFVSNTKTTAVPLKLAPYESAFIVFRNKAEKNEVSDITKNYPAPEIIADLKGPWRVSFDPAFRGPANPVVFETLQDWTTSLNDSIKYYSGAATYSITFTLPDNRDNKNIFD